MPVSFAILRENTNICLYFLAGEMEFAPFVCDNRIACSKKLWNGGGKNDI